MSNPLTARVAAALVVAALSSTALDAQLAPTAPISVDILAYARPVGRIVLTPTTPGPDEVLWQQTLVPSVLYITKVHPTKSGILGIVPAAGLCIDQAVAFTIVPDSIAIADVNGDGKDDVIGKVNGSVAQVLYGTGLVYCN